MNSRKLTRREALSTAGLMLGGASLAPALLTKAAGAQPAGGASSPAKPFLYSLNTATIRGHKLGIVKEIEVISKAGYDGFEPWIDAIDEYLRNGGTLPDLKKRIADAGLTVEGAVGFPEWVVDDDARRAKGLERAKREMDLIAQLGGKRVAAPAAGATGLPKLDPLKAAERYRVLLEAGEQIGVIPQLEMWGASKSFSRLGECVWVAMETGHRNACVLADVYHIYRGGSDYRGMRLLGPSALQVFHMNDYPADPPREKIDDSYRVFPGDGIAPITDMLRLLRATGGQKVLSLEVFNRAYWAQDPLEVAKAGLAKMKAAVEKL